MPTRTTKTAAGGTSIEVESGNVETRFSPQFDVSTAADFTTVWDTNIGDFSEGTVSLSAQVRANTGAEWSAIEARAVGYIGSTPSILGIWMLGGVKNTASFPIGEGKKFDRLAIEARIVVDGSPGPGSLTPLEARLSASAKLWG